jgi:hypothetical protein
MSFTAIFVMIFLIAFVLIGGVVMFLSKTIDHGEARFGPDGKMITGDSEKAAPKGSARPAQRIDASKASENE